MKFHCGVVLLCTLLSSVSCTKTDAERQEYYEKVARNAFVNGNFECGVNLFDSPLCGSDGKTYGSNSDLHCHNILFAHDHKPVVKVIHYGACQ